MEEIRNVLSGFDPNLEIVVATDVRESSIRAVILHKYEHSSLKIVAHVLHSLLPSELLLLLLLLLIGLLLGFCCCYHYLGFLACLLVSLLCHHLLTGLSNVADLTTLETPRPSSFHKHIQFLVPDQHRLGDVWQGIRFHLDR